MYANKSQTNIPTVIDLALIGNCGYRIDNQRVVIDIAEIANHRNIGNLSGTLSIELWALTQPYTSSGFSGHLLAGTTIGEISGQHFLSNCHYDLLFQEPPEGTWYLTLMLREWEGGVYAVRDYVNFAVPYIVSSKPAVTRSDSDNVINVIFPAKKTTQGSPEQEPVAQADSECAQVSETKAEASVAELSLNTASYQEIMAVKGVSKKLAENIIEKRPFSSFEELKKIKGIGPKILQKISRFFTL